MDHPEYFLIQEQLKVLEDKIEQIRQEIQNLPIHTEVPSYDEINLKPQIKEEKEVKQKEKKWLKKFFVEELGLRPYKRSDYHRGESEPSNE